MENLVEKPSVVPDIAGVCLTRYNMWYGVRDSTFPGRRGVISVWERYERERQAKWDRRNLRTVSTHLTVKEARALKEFCQRRGISQYALVRRLLREAMAADGA